MLDLETLGVRPGCVIVSIGAVVFDVHAGTLGKEFYRVVDRASCLRAGLVEEPETVAWWKEKGLEVPTVGAVGLGDALFDFAAWYLTVGGCYLWGHGAGFDQPILRAACSAVGMNSNSSWPYRFDMDTRTIFRLARMEYKAPGNHNALEDARAQALAVIEAWKRLEVG